MTDQMKEAYNKGYSEGYDAGFEASDEHDDFDIDNAIHNTLKDFEEYRYQLEVNNLDDMIPRALLLKVLDECESFIEGVKHE